MNDNNLSARPEHFSESGFYAYNEGFFFLWVTDGMISGYHMEEAAAT